MIRMGMNGWMFLLVLAYSGSPGQEAVKRLCACARVCMCVCVATCLRRGGIFKYNFITNLLLSLTVTKFRKPVNIWRSYGQKYGVLFFDLECILYSLYSRFRCSHCYNALSIGGPIPKIVPSPEGIWAPNIWFLRPTRLYNPNIICFSHLLGSHLWPTDRHRQQTIDHATSTARGCIFALCACDASVINTDSMWMHFERICTSQRWLTWRE